MSASDIVLRQGNGCAAVETIHAWHDLIPVIFITASPQHGHITGSHVRLLGKPASEALIRGAFIDMTPGSG